MEKNRTRGVGSLGEGIMIHYSESTPNSNIFLSDNNGAIWTPINLGLPNASIYSFVATEKYLYTLLNYNMTSYIYRSTNNGTSWALQKFPIDSINYNILTSYENKLFILLRAKNESKYNIYYADIVDEMKWEKTDVPDTTNGKAQNIWIASPYIYCLLYIIINNNPEYYVWRRPLSEIIPTNNKENARLKYHNNFTLYQNNSLNQPNISINYSVPEKCRITINIVDPMGKHVTTLLSGNHEPGSYSIPWDASKYKKGVYFCVLQGGNNIFMVIKIMHLK